MKKKLHVLTASLATATLALVIGMMAPATASADTPAETLEKGIYSEETEGNLNQAIEHYRQVLSDAQKTKELAAQAQYRLGRCLHKLGKTDEAEQAFEELLKGYPDQKDLIEKARKLMPSRPEMLPAPWKSGEQLTFVMTLPGGRPIGIVGTSVTEEMRDGKAVWEMNIRRHVAEENSGVSKVIIDKATNLPQTTHWDHTMLGKTEAQWGTDTIEITSTNDGKSETKTVTLDKPSYSNDQWFYGFRQLPMKVGNKITAPIRVAFTGGNALDMEIEVAAKEEIETPVGTFDCFRLDTNVQQTFWITDTPERYIAKFDAGGVQALLTSIGDGRPTTLTNDKVGFSVTVPAEWFYYERYTGNDMTSGSYRLVAPKSLVTASLNVRKKSMLDPEERESVQAWADHVIQQAKDNAKDARERDGSRKEVSFAGESGISLELELTLSGRAMLGSPTLAFKGDKAVELGVVSDASQFDANREAIDAIRKSVTVN